MIAAHSSSRSLRSPAEAALPSIRAWRTPASRKSLLVWQKALREGRLNFSGWKETQIPHGLKPVRNDKNKEPSLERFHNRCIRVVRVERRFTWIIHEPAAGEQMASAAG